MQSDTCYCKIQAEYLLCFDMTRLLRYFSYKTDRELRTDIRRANLVAKIVTTQNHDFFLYDHYGSRDFEPPLFLKPRPHVRF